MSLTKILEAASDKVLADAIITSFKEIESNYFKKSWKTSELDSGHFVESVRRFIELKLFGAYTPIGTTLPNFNDVEMKRYERASGDESYRLHIPRAMFTIYGIRNKRGVGHLGLIKPNKIDATLILSTSKWILAELTRLNSNIPLEKTELLVEEIIQRNIEGIWELGTIRRVLIDGLKTKEKILILLYNTIQTTDNDLQRILEIKTLKHLRGILRELHKARLIEFNNESGICILSPKGSLQAEEILKKAQPF